jgi:hypothetical protein
MIHAPGDLFFCSRCGPTSCRGFDVHAAHLAQCGLGLADDPPHVTSSVGTKGRICQRWSPLRCNIGTLATGVPSIACRTFVGIGIRIVDIAEFEMTILLPPLRPQIDLAIIFQATDLIGSRQVQERPNRKLARDMVLLQRDEPKESSNDTTLRVPRRPTSSTG